LLKIFRAGKIHQQYLKTRYQENCFMRGKSSKLNSIIAFFLTLVLIISFPLAAYSETTTNTEHSAKLEINKGSVEVKKKGEESWIEAEDGMKLKAGDSIKTLESSRAIINYFDGSVTRLGPKTEVLVEESAESSEQQGGVLFSIKQIAGNTWHRVKKLFGGESRYKVKTPTSVATVRGTVFRIDVYENGQTIYYVFDGEIEIEPEMGEIIHLSTGEKIIVAPGVKLTSDMIQKLTSEDYDDFYWWNMGEDAKLLGTGTSDTTTPTGTAGVSFLGTTYENQPVAALSAIPILALPGAPIYFNASYSFHKDPLHHIVAYQWDFNGDGTIDYVSNSPTVTYVYPAFGLYQASCTVVDDNVPPRTATVKVGVNIDVSADRAPIADAGGPYITNPNQSLALNGSNSYDPDAAYGDSIISYLWDLDGDGIYDDATGALANLPAGLLAQIGMIATDIEYPISIKVTDSYGLSSTANTTITVYPELIVDITNPVDGSTVNQRVITVTGTINDTSINSATLTINGQTSAVTVSNGSFSQSINLASGNNTITVSATDFRGQTASDTVNVLANIQLVGLWIQLVWDKDNTDVDSHLICPGGIYFSPPGDCYYSNRNPDWGQPGVTEDNPSLDQDDTNGYGPENITLQQPEEGTYTYKVHYYSDHGNGPTTATVIVYINEQPAATFSKELTSNEVWYVCTIDWPQGTVTENQAASANFSQSLSNQTNVLSSSFTGPTTSTTDPTESNEETDTNNTPQENSSDNPQQSPSGIEEIADQTQNTPSGSSQEDESSSSSDSSSETTPENTTSTGTASAN